ncbi:DUF1392 family protein [Nostoc sp. ChiQUE01b]
MINQINSLENCWFISPPWGQTNSQFAHERNYLRIALRSSTYSYVQASYT